jgi:hypothetical protein
MRDTHRTAKVITEYRMMARQRQPTRTVPSVKPMESRAANGSIHVALSAVRLAVLLAITIHYAESFVISHASPYTRKNFLGRQLSRFPATKSQEVTSASTDSITGTWSLSASNTRGESRFGLRRRVKAVLQNAKNRTGLPNLNSEADYTTESFSDSQGSSDLFNEADDYAFHEEIDEFSPRLDAGTDSDFLSTGMASDDVLLGPSTAAARKTPSSTTIRDQKPLPFTLPTLTEEQHQLLLKGERVQYQAKMGREGNGFVVVDIQAPPYVIWECLLDFEAYPEQIDTVRSMRMFTSTHLNSSYIAEDPVMPAATRSTRHYGRASITRASFVLSKFRLNIAAVHKYRPHPDGHYMTFTLDKACKNVVLQDAKGIWYTQACPDGRQDVTRVWLLCELKVSPLLPTFIVDYAAKRAMPRATTWLKPIAETAANRWLGTGM